MALVNPAASPLVPVVLGAAPGGGGKDSRWLTLEVCREFARSKCSRADDDCKYAHPPPHVDVHNGRVMCCFDSIKVHLIHWSYHYQQHLSLSNVLCFLMQQHKVSNRTDKQAFETSREWYRNVTRFGNRNWKSTFIDDLEGMGVNNGEDGGRISQQNLEWAWWANCPPDFVMFQNFKYRLLALQCSKKLTNPMILTENSLLPKSTSSTSTKSSLQAENCTLSGDDTDKKYRSECTKHARPFPWWGGVPLFPTLPFAHQVFDIPTCVPRTIQPQLEGRVQVGN